MRFGRSRIDMEICGGSIESGKAQNACPLRSESGPPRYVCFVPKGDICIAAALLDQLVGGCEQLVGNIEAEFLKLARMDDVRRSRVLDHAAARNSARRRVPDRGAGAGCLRLRRAGAADPEAAAHRHEGEVGPSGYERSDFRQAALWRACCST